MEPDVDEAQLRAVPDAGVLFVLPSGIQIVRRKKHEPIEIRSLRQRELERLTEKKEGSKFLPGTTLRRIIEMTCETLEENDAAAGANAVYTEVYDEPIGISRGRRVKGLVVRVSNRGTYAHGYPEDEKRL